MALIQCNVPVCLTQTLILGLDQPVVEKHQCLDSQAGLSLCQKLGHVCEDVWCSIESEWEDCELQQPHPLGLLKNDGT